MKLNNMQIYKFKVFQKAIVDYNSELSIEANTEEEAEELIKSLSDEDLCELCDNWKIALETVVFNNKISVFDKNNIKINKSEDDIEDEVWEEIFNKKKLRT